MSAKSFIKVLIPDGKGALFKWVALLTGSKDARKGAADARRGKTLPSIDRRARKAPRADRRPDRASEWPRIGAFEVLARGRIPLQGQVWFRRGALLRRWLKPHRDWFRMPKCGMFASAAVIFA